MLISPVILVILDGWGVSNARRGNAIREAETPTLDSIAAFHPSLTLQASGFAVGLLWGEAGNSAAGHMTIGAGRIIYSHLPRILREIRSGNFFENPVLKGAAAHVRRHGSVLHLVGLVSSASVHSYLDHLYALFDFAAREQVSRVMLHAVTDGRDAGPHHGLKILRDLALRIADRRYPVTLATVLGRYFAMDREENWDRTEQAWRALVEGAGALEPDLLAYAQGQYQKDVTDELLPPALLGDAEGKPAGRIAENDAVIFFNFREDGLRQLASAFAQDEFSAFPRQPPRNLYLVTFTPYEEALSAGVAFPPPSVAHTLPEVLSLHGVKQLRIAESVKYAQMTHFFNGGVEAPFRFEDRIVVPSDAPPIVASPEMKADEIAAEVIRTMERTAYEFILVNFANADTAAHSGDYAATVSAIEAVDRALGVLYQRLLHRRGALLLTADHGSAEAMVNIRTGEMKVGHSDNPVPFYFVTPRNRFRVMRTEEDIARRHAQPLGTLADVAPTVLELLNIKKPAEMTGRSLLALL